MSLSCYRSRYQYGTIFLSLGTGVSILGNKILTNSFAYKKLVQYFHSVLCFCAFLAIYFWRVKRAVTISFHLPLLWEDDIRTRFKSSQYISRTAAPSTACASVANENLIPCYFLSNVNRYSFLHSYRRSHNGWSELWFIDWKINNKQCNNIVCRFYTILQQYLAALLPRWANNLLL